MRKETEKDRLPNALKKYVNEDFAVKLKVRFIYYLCISCIAFIVPILLYTSYVQLIDTNYNGLYYPVIIAEASIIALFLICFLVLLKGYYKLSVHLLLICAMSCVWFIMWVDRGDAIMRLDSIVFVPAILSMLPLLITKNKYAIPAYTAVNLILLYVFVYFFTAGNFIPRAAAVDFLADSSVAIIFTGIVAYNIFRINNLSLDKAKSDMNMRKAAEEALAKSEKRYREMADLLPQTIFEYDLTGRLTYVNKSGTSLFGYSEEDFNNGIDLIATIVPEEREKARMNIQKVFQGAANLGNEYRAIKKDGTIFPILVYSTRVMENERPVGLLGILIDITETKNNEESIKRSEEKFRSIIQGLSDTIIIIDKNGKIFFQSPSVFKTLGYSDEEMLGKSPTEFIHPDDVAGSSEELMKVFNSTNKGIPTFSRVMHKDGSIIYMETIGLNMLENKFVNGIVIFGRNVTDRVLAEKELKESEERYRTLMESMNEIVMVVDNDDTVLYTNKRFYEVFGYSKDEIIGKTGYKILLNEKDHGLIVEKNKIRQKRISDQYEIKFKTKENLWKDFLVGASPIHNSLSEVVGSIGVMTDITDRKIAEEELEKHRRNLEQLVQERTNELAKTVEELGKANNELLRQREELQITNRELDSFSYSVSHDLRSPLRSINGFSQILIEDHSKQLSPEAIKYLEKICHGTNHMGILINEILRFSRISRHSVTMNTVNLNSLISDIWNSIETERNEREIQFNLISLPHCQGDLPLLKQAFYNIISNALKYTRNCKIALIEIGSLKNHNESSFHNVYYIKDNGVGFDMKYSDKLFGVFQRLHTDKEFEGIGVGLAIVQRIIEKHGGRIWVESIPNSGTTFYLSLKKGD